MKSGVQRILKTGVVLTLGGAALISAMNRWESQELTAYADKLAGGLPTFCSGSTSWSVKPGTKFTKAQCDEIDMKVAIKYGDGVLACVNHQFIDQNSLDALTLFAINVGVAGACGSRAVRLINQGLIADGCRALRYGPNGQPVWSYANGQFVRGLANRRWFEMNWCLKSTGVIDD